MHPFFHSLVKIVSHCTSVKGKTDCNRYCFNPPVSLRRSSEVQSPWCPLCSLLFWIQYECPHSALSGGKHTTDGQEVILGLTVCLDVGAFLSLCEAFGGWSVLPEVGRQGFCMGRSMQWRAGCCIAAQAVWGALCTGKGFSECLSVLPSKECCHLKSLLTVNCCWAFSATFPHVCPSIQNATALCLGKIPLRYVTRKAVTVLVVWTLWPQYTINYILETFLGQIKQHSCTLHKRLWYLKHVSYSIHLWLNYMWSVNPCVVRTSLF